MKYKITTQLGASSRKLTFRCIDEERGDITVMAPRGTSFYDRPPMYSEGIFYTVDIIYIIGAIDREVEKIRRGEL